MNTPRHTRFSLAAKIGALTLAVAAATATVFIVTDARHVTRIAAMGGTPGTAVAQGHSLSLIDTATADTRIAAAPLPTAGQADLWRENVALALVVALAAGLVGLLVGRHAVLRPISTLEAAMRDCARCGALPAASSFARDEFGDLAMTFRSVAACWQRTRRTDPQAEIARLKEQIAALETSNGDLDDFAHIASHDLKEPLRGVSKHAAFLSEDYYDRLEEGGRRRLDRILFLCQRMDKLIDDLLHFSRLGRQRLAIKSTDLNDVIDDIATTIDTTLREQHVEIRIPVPLPVITCDEFRLTEVFRNLIVNAIKYNRSDPKIVEIGATFDVPPDSSTTQVIFHVRDNGVGIPEQFRDDVFRIFKRLNDEDEAVKGTGIGLAFVKKIVERHGGKVWVESNDAGGATFRFFINDDEVPRHAA